VQLKNKCVKVASSARHQSKPAPSSTAIRRSRSKVRVSSSEHPTCWTAPPDLKTTVPGCLSTSLILSRPVNTGFYKNNNFISFASSKAKLFVQRAARKT
jgi:hypothetical protein